MKLNFKLLYVEVALQYVWFVMKYFKMMIKRNNK